MSGAWILIPARGKSKGIPYKNILRLRAQPLILYCLASSLQVLPSDQVIVSTDDDVIAALVCHRCTVHERPEHLAEDKTTLDEVAVNVAQWLLDRGASPSDSLLTIQPTSPFLPPTAIREALELLASGAGSVLSVKDDTHLRWGFSDDGNPVPCFSERLNRQWLPRTFVETGGLIGSHLGTVVETGTRVNEPIRLIELGPAAALDIDTPSDWALAEFYSRRRRIVLRADGGVELGMGHLYRLLALYGSLHEHERQVVTRCDGEFAPGAQFLADKLVDCVWVKSEEEFYDFLAENSPDIVTLDMLDTSVEHVSRVKQHARFVVCFEDLGPGAHHADLVVNDLYLDPDAGRNHWSGVEYSLVAPQFEALGPVGEPAAEVKRVLVTFGGSDPSHLTEKALVALAALDRDIWVMVVLGPACADLPLDLADYGLKGEVFRSVGHMAVLMHSADLAVTAAGRTVTELMTQGVPTIAMCQNSRELQHTHASSPFGVLNLGLGAHVDAASLQAHIGLLMDDREMRLAMYRKMLRAVRSRSNQAITRRILKAAADKRH